MSRVLLALGGLVSALGLVLPAAGSSGATPAVGTPAEWTHFVVDAKWLPSFIAGTRIGKIQQIAGRWSLVSSPICV